MADLWPYRDGILPYTALCPVRPWRGRRRWRDVGHSGGVGVRRAAFDLIRSSTVDDENPLRLDRGCRDPIRDCWRNHWRDLQAYPGENDALWLGRFSVDIRRAATACQRAVWLLALTTD